jgi:cobalt transporter subunit CbtB
MLDSIGTPIEEKHMQASTALDTTGIRVSTAARRLPALAVLLFGAVILYGVGFSSFSRAHNAAHDTRHANGFPCH